MSSDYTENEWFDETDTIKDIVDLIDSEHKLKPQDDITITLIVGGKND